MTLIPFLDKIKNYVLHQQYHSRRKKGNKNERTASGEHKYMHFEGVV